MEDIAYKILTFLGTVFLGYLAFSEFLHKRNSRNDQQEDAQNKAHNQLELKVKELEGRIETQYTELKEKLVNVERALAEDKNNKTVFEHRILASVDKIEQKIEKVSDLVVQAFISINQPKKSQI